ncbi:hypothetical protein [Oscillatoria acuminata]|uniref:Uncharacterized protein n=1 Tax=Oscillatoria acuminata PCC 6304 TaxID=56110 RepID=K9TQM4_9CYAN|nr:hypothetical protein [Oscillatoria acuminata]AFY84279.1 hypothetical protein Oscil6304_4768 [Oscillatoria acuminata PCC 6304]
MINFDKLTLVVNDKYAFVGIERRNGELQFCLPKCFKEHLSLLQNFDDRRDLFFLFYKIFDRFQAICIENGYLDKNPKQKTSDRDGVIRIAQGSEVSTDNQEEEENIFYSKLDLFTGILNAYDEPKILSLAYRLGKSEVLDHSQSHKFLHKAIFLENGAAYIDEMNLPRQQVQFESTDIVEMYCYLLCEINQQLDQEVIPEIQSLSDRFSHKHIEAGYSLFDENSYEWVMDILKDALEVIHHNTPLKDADYWDFYEAIELFLYGELRQTNNGEVWGINNFYSVWESMCLTYFLKTTPSSNILYLDDKWVSGKLVEDWKKEPKKIDLLNAFKFNEIELFPDIVIINDPHPEEKVTYSLIKDSWNDYGYSTFTHLRYNQIKVFDIYEKKVVKIDREERYKERYEDPIECLQRYYHKSNNTILIDKPFPENVYSFWLVHDRTIENKEWHQMNYFNHIFYIAFKKGLFKSDEFINKFIEPLKEKYLFKNSLIRDAGTNEELSSQFNSFLSGIKERLNYSIDVIDLKYSDIKYYLKPENQEDIKTKDVRKQFVYEYLLQKNETIIFLKSNIVSKFILPGYKQHETLKYHPEFMAGYIRLMTLNFEIVARHYFS